MGMTNREKFREVYGFDTDCGKCNPYPCEEDDCEWWEQCKDHPGCPCENWWDLEYKAPEQERMIDKSNFSQEQYKTDLQCAYDCGKSVLDKIREQFKNNLRGVEIALEVLDESNPLRPKMEGAKVTMEECLELIDKAESEEK